MKMRSGTLAVLMLAAMGPGAAQAAQDPLPVRKVVLYKNGMGYFEHLGSVRGAQAVEITLPRSQMNDVLKSLTVIDLGGGQISGVTYDSAAPLERRLGELPVELGTARDLVGFLNQVRGAEVTIQAPGGTVAGRLMGAEMRARTSPGGAALQSLELSILSPAGELKLVGLESAGALQFADKEFAADMYRYLDILSSRQRRDVRKLVIRTTGAGERRLYVGYTSESPIWKTTYRIVLDPAEKPLLQGWAIVDNTTPVDWVDVSLSLVAGAPISFVQNLSQPVYARRPVVPLPEGVQTRPQLHEGTLEVPTGQGAVSGTVRNSAGAAVSGARVSLLDESGDRIAEARTDDAGRYRIEAAPGRYTVTAGGARGYGEAVQPDVAVSAGRETAVDLYLESGGRGARDVLGTTAEAGVPEMQSALRALKPMLPAPGSETAAIDEIGRMMRSEAPPAAQAQALGEQFEYRLRQPVTIRRNESALLPIIHTAVEGEKVSLFNAAFGESRPRLAVWLKNTSGLTLDGGAFTVIDGNAFAGEGLIGSVQPGESRLLSYALDLGVEVSSRSDTQAQRVERVEISRGIVRMHSKLTERKVYVVRNNDDKARTVVLEHPVRSGWSLVDTPPAAESSASYYRFKIDARPKTTTEFAVREQKPQETTYMITNLTSDQIAVWLKEKSLDPEMEKALSAVVARKAEIGELARKIAALEKEQSDIFRDQERVRENLQRMGGTPEEAALRLRYVKQLDQQENRIGAIRAERDKLEQARAAAQRQLDDMIQKLSFERKL